jgi:2-C-methyl-D-erythritol 4-phosphate cytidylyltransferase
MSNPGKAAVIIAAGGASSRMDGVDKLFAVLAGKPLLAHTVAAFENSDAIGEIVIAVNPDSIERCRALSTEMGWRKVSRILAGGARRQDSVANGLAALGEADRVMVHDGARPLVNADIINRGLEAAGETGAAIAAVPVKDTIKLAEADLMIMGTPPRENLWAAQTPQVFRRDIITRAYAPDAPEASDDAALVERLGIRVKLFHGSYDNIKVTTPADLILAEILLKR